MRGCARVVLFEHVLRGAYCVAIIKRNTHHAPRTTPPRSTIMDMDSTIILTLVSFICGMVMGIVLVRPNRSR